MHLSGHMHCGFRGVKKDIAIRAAEHSDLHPTTNNMSSLPSLHALAAFNTNTVGVLKDTPWELRKYLKGITEDNVRKLREEATKQVDTVMYEISKDICTLMDTPEMADYKATGVMPPVEPQVSQTVVNLQPFGKIFVWVQIQANYMLGVALKAKGVDKKLQEALDLEINSLQSSRAMFIMDVNPTFFNTEPFYRNASRLLSASGTVRPDERYFVIQKESSNDDSRTVNTKEDIVNAFKDFRWQINNVRLHDTLNATVESFITIAIRLSMPPTSSPLEDETASKRYRPEK